MLLSEEHRLIRIEYLKEKMKTLPKGSVKGNRIYITEQPDNPERKNCYYRATGFKGEKLLAGLKKREELEAKLEIARNDSVYVPDKKKHRFEPIDMSYKLFEQMSHSQDSNPRYKKPYSPLANNIRVRSKSEQNIAEFYTGSGLPWLYESSYIWDDTHIYPDFTCYIEEIDKTFFHEHLGMIDKETYRKDAMEKYEFYLRKGFIPGRDIIFTYESSTDGFDINTLRTAIDQLIKNNR